MEIPGTYFSQFGDPFWLRFGPNLFKQARPKRNPRFLVNRAPVYTGARFSRSRGLQNEVEMHPKRSPNGQKGASRKEERHLRVYTRFRGPEKMDPEFWRSMTASRGACLHVRGGVGPTAVRGVLQFPQFSGFWLEDCFKVRKVRK